MTVRTRPLLFGVAMVLAAFFVGFGLITTRTWLGDTVNDQVWSGILNGLPGWLRQPLDRFARDVAPVALAVVADACSSSSVSRAGTGGRFSPGSWSPPFLVILTAPVHLQDASGPVGGSYPSNHATAGLGLLAAVIVLWPTPSGARGWLPRRGLAYVLCLGNVSWYAHAPGTSPEACSWSWG